MQRFQHFINLPQTSVEVFPNLPQNLMIVASWRPTETRFMFYKTWCTIISLISSEIIIQLKLIYLFYFFVITNYDTKLWYAAFSYWYSRERKTKKRAKERLIKRFTFSHNNLLNGLKFRFNDTTIWGWMTRHNENYYQ